MGGIDIENVYVVYDLIMNSFKKVFITEKDATIECDIEIKNTYDTHRVYAKHMTDSEFDTHFKQISYGMFFKVMTLNEAIEKIKEHYCDIFSNQDDNYFICQEEDN